MNSFTTVRNALPSAFAALALLFSVGACTKKTDAPTGTTSGTSDSSSASTAASGDEILIGEVGSLTGSEATFGTSTRDGIDLAIKQINEGGGIKGKKLRVIVLDDQGKPEEAAIAVTKLITQDKVSAILGEVSSSRSLAMAPIAQSHKIPMITPSSTNPKVTQIGDYIFRVCFIDPFQGSVMAKFARNSLKANTAAILRDIKNDYSMGLAEFFNDTFTKMGGKVTVIQSYSAGDVDFKTQLSSIKALTGADKPDVIFVPGYYTEVGLIARQARSMGFKVPLLGGDGWDSEKLTEIGENSLDGSYFSNHYSPDDKSPHVQKFIADYKTVFNRIPDGLAAMGYDAAMVLADAMKRAKTLASEDVRAAIAETKNYPGVTGNITINKDRDAEKPAVVLEVKDKRFIYKETINPS
ncbi:MAG: ABC transporter substrate-binding protein [Bdellovibrionota bacterium]